VFVILVDCVNTVFVCVLTLFINIVRFIGRRMDGQRILVEHANSDRDRRRSGRFGNYYDRDRDGRDRCVCVRAVCVCVRVLCDDVCACVCDACMCFACGVCLCV